MKNKVFSGSPWEEKVGYCRALKIGNMVEVSGTTAMRDGALQGIGDAYVQTKVILEIIGEALSEIGATFDDVYRTRIYFTNAVDFAEIGRAHGEVFGKIQPAATAVGVAELVNPDMLVEIEVQAYVK